MKMYIRNGDVLRMATSFCRIFRLVFRRPRVFKERSADNHILHVVDD
jgi:hypothetical protein